MPSVTEKQHRLMEARKHGWNPPGAKNLPPKSVAEEFVAADKAAGKFQGKGLLARKK